MSEVGGEIIYIKRKVSADLSLETFSAAQADSFFARYRSFDIM